MRISDNSTNEDLIEFAKDQCEIFPEDSEMGMYLRETMKMLQAEFCTLDDAREDFVFDVYNILDFLPTNNEANQIIDVFDRVTSGLEQAEPCGDAVSRKAVLDMATVIETDDFSGNEIMEVVETDDIKVLPSVTPTRIETVTEFADRCRECGKQKKGKWVLTDDDMIYCSECEDSYYPRPIDASWKYCPNCGAEMESE